MFRLGRRTHILTVLVVGGGLGLSISSGLAQTKSSAVPPPGINTDAGRAIPANQTIRWVIPNYGSIVTGSGSRSFTAITVMNNSGLPCDATVTFQFAAGTTDICTITKTGIPKRTSWIFCSRAVNDPVTPCLTSCNPALTFNTGHAYVSSTKSDACAKISVDAQLINTQDAADDSVVARTKLTVHKLTGMTGD